MSEYKGFTCRIRSSPYKNCPCYGEPLGTKDARYRKDSILVRIWNLHAGTKDTAYNKDSIPAAI